MQRPSMQRLRRNLTNWLERPGGLQHSQRSYSVAGTAAQPQRVLRHHQPSFRTARTPWRAPDKTQRLPQHQAPPPKQPNPWPEQPKRLSQPQQQTPPAKQPKPWPEQPKRRLQPQQQASPPTQPKPWPEQPKRRLQPRKRKLDVAEPPVSQRLPSKSRSQQELDVAEAPVFQRLPGKQLSQQEWKVSTDLLTENLMSAESFRQLSQECQLQPAWRPQVTMLLALGLTPSDLRRLARSRADNGIFSLQVPTIKAKLAFLREEVGLKDEDLVKLLVKFPRILEYKTERTLRPHLQFFQRYGLDKEEICKVVQRCPCAMELSVEHTLEARVQFLARELGIEPAAVGKIMAKSPNILTYSEEFIQQRLAFLQQHKFSSSEISKIVQVHPQALHYSPDRMAGRLDFLRRIGMTPPQLRNTIARLPQLLSLDIEANLAPKYDYLQQQLGGNIETVCSFPAYLTLSLPQRIKPRHRWWTSQQKDSKRPFSMSLLKCSDAAFASLTCSSLAQYTAFKSQFLA